MEPQRSYFSKIKIRRDYQIADVMFAGDDVDIFLKKDSYKKNDSRIITLNELLGDTFGAKFRLNYEERMDVFTGSEELSEEQVSFKKYLDQLQYYPASIVQGTVGYISPEDKTVFLWTELGALDRAGNVVRIPLKKDGSNGQKGTSVDARTIDYILVKQHRDLKMF